MNASTNMASFNCGIQLFLVGSICIVRDKLLLLAWYTCHKIVIIDSSKSFSLLLFNFLKIHGTNNLFNKGLHIFLYLVNIILEIL